MSRRPRTDPTKSKTIEAEYNRLLKSYFAEQERIVADAIRLSGANSFTVKNQLDYFMDRPYQRMQLALRALVKKMYAHGIKWSDLQLRSGRQLASIDATMVGAGLMFSEPDQKTIDILVAKNGDLIKSLTQDLKDEVMRIIRIATIENKSIDEIVKLINDFLPVVYNRAERIVRTETMYAVNQATLTRYDAAGVKSVEWLAAEDERTCAICGAHDGESYSIGKVPQIPAHPNCRCTTIPKV